MCNTNNALILWIKTLETAYFFVKCKCPNSYSVRWHIRSTLFFWKWSNFKTKYQTYWCHQNTPMQTPFGGQREKRINLIHCVQSLKVVLDKKVQDSFFHCQFCHNNIPFYYPKLLHPLHSNDKMSIFKTFTLTCLIYFQV